MANQQNNRNMASQTNAGSTAEKAQSKVAETAKSAAEEAQHQAQKVAGKVEQEARSTINTRKEQAADQLDGIASAFRETGNQLRDQDSDWAAGYAENLAEQVERFSGYLHNGDFNQFLSDAEDLARRQPEIFLGGAFTLGLIAARFFKSSSPDRGRAYRGGYSQRSDTRGARRAGWEYGEDWRNKPSGRTTYDPNRYGTENVENYPVATGVRTTTARTETMTTPTGTSYPSPESTRTANRNMGNAAVTNPSASETQSTHTMGHVDKKNDQTKAEDKE